MTTQLANGKNSSQTNWTITNQSKGLDELIRLEDIIDTEVKSVQHSWMVIGETLGEIKKRKLYKYAKAGSPISWAGYLDLKNWQFLSKSLTVRRVNQHIEAVAVAKTIEHETGKKVPTLAAAEKLVTSTKKIGLEETAKKYDQVAKDAGGDAKKISKALTVPKKKAIAKRPEKQCIESEDGQIPLKKAKKIVGKLLERISAQPYKNFRKDLETVADCLVEVGFFLPSDNAETQLEVAEEERQATGKEPKGYRVMITPQVKSHPRKTYVEVCGKLGLVPQASWYRQDYDTLQAKDFLTELADQIHLLDTPVNIAISAD